MVVVRSDSTLTWMLGGIAASRLVSVFLMLSTVVDDVRAGLLEHDEEDAALAVATRPPGWCRSGPSTALPMSRTRTGAPLR